MHQKHANMFQDDQTTQDISRLRCMLAQACRLGKWHASTLNTWIQTTDTMVKICRIVGHLPANKPNQKLFLCIFSQCVTWICTISCYVVSRGLGTCLNIFCQGKSTNIAIYDKQFFHDPNACRRRFRAHPGWFSVWPALTHQVGGPTDTMKTWRCRGRPGSSFRKKMPTNVAYKHSSLSNGVPGLLSDWLSSNNEPNCNDVTQPLISKKSQESWSILCIAA